MKTTATALAWSLLEVRDHSIRQLIRKTGTLKKKVEKLQGKINDRRERSAANGLYEKFGALKKPHVCEAWKRQLHSTTNSLEESRAAVLRGDLGLVLNAVVQGVYKKRVLSEEECADGIRVAMEGKFLSKGGLVVTVQYNQETSTEEKRRPLSYLSFHPLAVLQRYMKVSENLRPRTCTALQRNTIFSMARGIRYLLAGDWKTTAKYPRAETVVNVMSSSSGRSQITYTLTSHSLVTYFFIYACGRILARTHVYIHAWVVVYIQKGPAGTLCVRICPVVFYRKAWTLSTNARSEYAIYSTKSSSLVQATHN